MIRIMCDQDVLGVIALPKPCIESARLVGKSATLREVWARNEVGDEAEGREPRMTRIARIEEGQGPVSFIRVVCVIHELQRGHDKS